MFVCLAVVNGEVNGDHLVKVMSAEFFHHHVTGFFFILCKYLGGDALKLCQPSLS